MPANCAEQQEKAMVTYWRTGKLRKSDHQKTNCRMCRQDSTAYNHCSWCGSTFKSFKELGDHLEGK